MIDYKFIIRPRKSRLTLLLMPDSMPIGRLVARLTVTSWQTLPDRIHHGLSDLTGPLLYRFHPVLRINLNQHRWPFLLQNLRLDHKRPQQNGFLRLAVVIADAVVAAGGFVPGLVLLVDFGFLVVHGAENLALEHMADHRGGAVAVRGRGAVGWVLDQHAEDG